MDVGAFLLVLRYALTALGTYLIAHGLATSDQVQPFIGGVLAIAPAIFGWISHQQQKAAVVEAAHTGVATPASPLSPMTVSPAAVADAADATANTAITK